MDILVALLIVIVLSWVVHSLFWALVFFILGCIAVGVYRRNVSGTRRF